jgi:Zn-dependent protease with chaperone function
MFRVNGLYGHVRRNDLLSVVLFAGFLIGFHIAAVAVLLLPLMMFDPSRAPMPDTMAYVSSYGIWITLAAGLFFLVMTARQTRSVQAQTGFRFVTAREAPRLHRVAVPLAIAAGIPEPALGIMPVAARNAFAMGLSPRNSCIVVTQGLLDALNDDELGAVIAHEVTHIANRDTRLLSAARLMLAGVDWIERRNPFRITSWRRLVFFALIPFFLVMALLISLMVQIGHVIAAMTRLSISSAREFIADAEAVRLTHDPAALISALRKVEGHGAIPGLGVGLDAMMIDGAWSGATATHPPISERVAVLLKLTGGMATAPVMAKAVRPREASAKPTTLAQPASLASRVRAGSSRNMFGLTPRMSWAVIALIGGFQLYALVGFRMAESAMGNGPVSREISPEIGQAVAAPAVPAGIANAPLR